MTRPRGFAVAGWLLAAVSAWVVVWQNRRVTSLFDLAYILENAWRIAAGDLPYRDFPLPHAPGTFLIQAAIIKVFDATWVHHLAYAAIVTGLGTWLTVQIATRILEPFTHRAGWLAVVLCAPLPILGLCVVYPHPFYDSDACFFLLLAVWTLMVSRDRPERPGWGFAAGALLVVPIFIKQNIGLAAFGLVHLTLLPELLDEPRRALSRWRWVILGSSAAVVLALGLIHATVGMASYYEWTITYARARRQPPWGQQLDVYRDWVVLAWAGLWAGAAFALGRFSRLLPVRLGAVALLSIPFLWILPGAFGVGSGLPIPLRNVMTLWGFVMLVAWPAALVLVRRRGWGFDALLPLVCAGTAHATLLSQGVGGSTYGIWPLLFIGLAAALAALRAIAKDAPVGALAPVMAVAIGIAAAGYVVPHYRLGYFSTAGEIAEARSPRLAGMRTPGGWLPELDALITFCDANIPPADHVITMPGEDPFFYATRRRPNFPILLWESSTLNPYSNEQLIAFFTARDIRWVVVKHQTQLGFRPMDLGPVLAMVERDYARVYQSGPYEVFRRNP